MENVKQINILKLNDKQLVHISKTNLLALDLEEMRCVQKYFRSLKRNPTDIELETVAQTWSEHCKHKTLTGIIEYKEVSGKKTCKTKVYNNLLKETVFRITKELNKKWCISVFQDNAGIIEFDSKYGVAFKVETHNHPSAIEPYGGSATGIGGVIRDILGVGKGAKPILNTDVFCFGPLDYPYERLLKGVFHPKRIFKGVVSGVRDYGNRMGIPTANGAVWFDKGFVYNPLVYCGTVGMIPKNKSFKKVSPGEVIISVGGRTGRDGIHGATFSSLALDKDTPLSPVQIGNPIIEKKVTDTILQARDMELYSALTDCGAGGFSSAIGELASECGCRVYIDKAPLKYAGLLPWEIWVSEAQERMVLSVPKENVDAILKLFADENVEATVMGEFTSNGKMEIFYSDELICELGMEFLHKGLPKKKMQAIWNLNNNPEAKIIAQKQNKRTVREEVISVLSSLNVCSKEWVIRQYDHEVQGQTVLKPLQGDETAGPDGPGDACVVWPVTSCINVEKNNKEYKGIAVACGLNPDYGKIDPYWMAASSIDETLRNITCVGGDITRTALLDNFCWGDPKKPDQLAGVVRASQACYDMAKVYETPFISGKDSLNNDYVDEDGKMHSIPGTLLISGIAIVNDIRNVVSMYLKKPGNLIYILGDTKNELGGSQYNKVYEIDSGSVPVVNPFVSKKLMLALNKAMDKGYISACHDCSDGGLVTALAEMSFAGGLGLDIELADAPVNFDKTKFNETELDKVTLFSESNSRFIVEISPACKNKFELIIKDNIFACIGKVRKDNKLVIAGSGKKTVFNEDIEVLKDAWKNSLAKKL